MTEALINAAINSGAASPRTKPTKNLHRRPKTSLLPWFDTECKQIKKDVRSKLNQWRAHPSNNHLKEDYFHAKKLWKKIIKSKKLAAKMRSNVKICQLASTEPKSFWRLLKNDSVPPNNIQKNEWELHFRRLAQSNLPTLPHLEPGNTSRDTESIENDPECEANLMITEKISHEEVIEAIKSLHNGKSPGLDKITNEMLKHLPLNWTELLTSIFNHIIENCKFPKLWSLSKIKPIYKSGVANDPNNYRGISLSSCMGKVFTSILSKRIASWAENNHILCDEQFGFRTGRRTSDAVYILHSLIQSQILKKKQLYCCFIDFKQAFDTIPHSQLWLRLQQTGIPLKIVKLLQSYYLQAASCVGTPKGDTNYFTIEQGVKQGCNLSPLLFSLYINNLPRLISHPNITLSPPTVSCLMFADDIVIFSNDPNELQYSLTQLDVFCETSLLKINMNKTKIVTFGKHPERINHHWKIGETYVDVADCYKYLGTWLHWSGNYTFCLSKIVESARKASCILQHKIYTFGITDVQIQLRLFNAMIKPILLYNSEI